MMNYLEFFKPRKYQYGGPSPALVKLAEREPEEVKEGAEQVLQSGPVQFATYFIPYYGNAKMLYDASYNGGIGLENAWNSTKQGDFLGAGKAVGQQVLPNLGMGLLSLLPYTPLAVKTIEATKGAAKLTKLKRFKGTGLSNTDATSVAVSGEQNAMDYHLKRLSSDGAEVIKSNSIQYIDPKDVRCLDIMNDADVAAFAKSRGVQCNNQNISVIRQQLESELQKYGHAMTLINPKTGLPNGTVLYNSSKFANKEALTAAISHEIDHAFHVPKGAPEGLGNLKLQNPAARAYFLLNNGTEVAARGSQLRDFLQHTEYQMFTGSSLKQAMFDYIQKGPLNNNMKELYASVSDWDKLAEWMNKNASSLLLPVGAIEINELYKNGTFK